jgi:hypothetical protein
MKSKVLMATNLLFAVVIYFQNCILPKQVIVPPETIDKNYHCINYNDSVFNGLRYSLTKSLFENYGTTQYANITAGSNAVIDDSRCVWFSLDILKKFIYKVEDTLYRRGLDQSTRLGLRFYFATYPDSAGMAANTELNDLPSSYAKHHTLFIVPTYDEMAGGTVTHWDFNAFEGLNNVSRKPVANYKAMDKIVNTDPVMAVLTVNDETYMQNHGEVGPPPKPVPGATHQ